MASRKNKSPRKKPKRAVNKSAKGKSNIVAISIGGIGVAALTAAIGIAQVANGNWNSRIVVSLLGAAAVTTFAALWEYHFNESKASARAIAMLLVGIFTISAPFAHRIYYLSYWHAPEIPQGVGNATIYLGTRSCTFPIADLEERHQVPLSALLPPGTPLPPVSVYVKDHGLYADVDIPTAPGTLTVRGHTLNTDALPPGWDAQTSNQALEIVDSAQEPVLQIYYRKPQELIVVGTIRAADGIWIFDQTGCRYWPQSSDIESATRRMPKAMFMYPSEMHPGNYAEDWKPLPTAWNNLKYMEQDVEDMPTNTDAWISDPQYPGHVLLIHKP